MTKREAVSAKLRLFFKNQRPLKAPLQMLHQFDDAKLQSSNVCVLTFFRIYVNLAACKIYE